MRERCIVQQFYMLPLIYIQCIILHAVVAFQVVLHLHDLPGGDHLVDESHKGLLRELLLEWYALLLLQLLVQTLRQGHERDGLLELKGLREHVQDRFPDLFQAFFLSFLHDAWECFSLRKCN